MIAVTATAAAITIVPDVYKRQDRLLRYLSLYLQPPIKAIIFFQSDAQLIRQEIATKPSKPSPVISYDPAHSWIRPPKTDRESHNNSTEASCGLQTGIFLSILHKERCV